MTILSGGALLAALAVASAPDGAFAAWFAGSAALTPTFGLLGTCRAGRARFAPPAQ